MKSKESVEYRYQAEKSIFGIALRAPKGNHSVRYLILCADAQLDNQRHAEQAECISVSEGFEPSQVINDHNA